MQYDVVAFFNGVSALSNRKALFAVDRRLRLTRGSARRRIEVGFPVAHFFYQLLIDTANGVRGQWTAFSQISSLCYYLLFSARNCDRQMCLALNVAYLLNHSSAFLK